MTNDKPSYRAATAAAQAGIVSVANGALPFFIISGPASGIVVVHRVVVTAPTLTAAAYAVILATKHSSAWTGGTPVALTQVPNDSGLAAGNPTLCQVYTAGPTGGGALVGTLAARKTVVQISSSFLLIPPVEFEFGKSEHCRGIYLRSAAESLALAFAAAPGSATSLSLEVEWSQR